MDHWEYLGRVNCEIEGEWVVVVLDDVAVDSAAKCSVVRSF